MANITWTGALEAAWSAPENWSTGTVPVAGDVVHVVDATITVDVPVHGKLHSASALLEFVAGGEIAEDAELVPSAKLTTLQSDDLQWKGVLSGSGQIRVIGDVEISFRAGLFDGLLVIDGEADVLSDALLGGQVEVMGLLRMSGKFAWRLGRTLIASAGSVVASGNTIVDMSYANVDYTDVRWRSAASIVAVAGARAGKGLTVDGSAHGVWRLAVDGENTVLMWCPSEKGAMITLHRSSWIKNGTCHGKIESCGVTEETEELLSQWGSPSVDIGGSFSGLVSTGAGAVDVIIDPPNNPGGEQAKARAISADGEISGYEVTVVGTGYSVGNTGAYLIHQYPQQPTARATSPSVIVDAGGGYIDALVKTSGGSGYVDWERMTEFERTSQSFFIPDNLPLVFQQCTDYPGGGADFATSAAKLWLDTVTARIHTALYSLRDKASPLQVNDVTIL